MESTEENRDPVVAEAAASEAVTTAEEQPQQATQPEEVAPQPEEVAAETAISPPESEEMDDDDFGDEDMFADEVDGIDRQQLTELYDESMRNLKEGEIVSGVVIGITDNDVIIDVGYKSEGLVSKHEFIDRATGTLEVGVGDEVEVLLEKTEDQEGHVLLSRTKAERMRRWTHIEDAYKQGLVITGRVLDRIKGGLTIDVGLRAFLPGSLVDIKPVKHLESLKGEQLEFKVISLDRRRNNIVLSRKAVLEKEFAKKKAETLTKLEAGARLPGVVKNITDYGVFIDLGGIDGLLHITDISWGRVNHPSEHFGVGDEVEIIVLKFDPQTERVSLGYKQKGDDPWSLVDKKYPIGSRVEGKVVSLVDYGAFIEIEEGVEGLIHVSEMSWTKKVVNPSKVLSVSQEVQAIVSELDMDQRRISLSLRQTERNPWEELGDQFPIGSIIEGKVRNLTEFGAFVEITEGIDGLIHVSDMSWTKRVKHPNEVLKKGESVRARITNIDTSNQRVSLSIKEFMPNEWEDFVASHQVGATLDGKVVNVTDFGLFIDIYEGLEGLAHVSEIDLPSGKVEDHFSLGDWVSARILRIEDLDKKVGLSMQGVAQPSEEEVAELEAADQAKQGSDDAVADQEAADEESAEEETVEGSEVEAASEETASRSPGEAEASAEAEAGEEEPQEASEAAAEGDEESPEVEAEADEAEADEPAAEAAADAADAPDESASEATDADQEGSEESASEATDSDED